MSLMGAKPEQTSDEAARTAAEAAAKAEALAALPEYSIAPGRSLTTRRGMLHEGAELFARDLADADEAGRLSNLAEQVTAGVVLHNPKASKK